jgi:hypothetical protein
LVLARVGDNEGDFGMRRIFKTVVATDCDQLVAPFHHKCHSIDAINLREMVDLFSTEIKVRIKVPHGDSPLREMGVESAKRFSIGRGDRANNTLPAVTKKEWLAGFS